MNGLLTTSLLAASTYNLSLLAAHAVANAEWLAEVDTTPPSTGLSLPAETPRNGDDSRARFILALQHCPGPSACA